MQLYSHVVTVRQPFELRISLVFLGHLLGTGGVLLSHYGVMLVEYFCHAQTT